VSAIIVIPIRREAILTASGAPNACGHFRWWPSRTFQCDGRHHGGLHRRLYNGKASGQLLREHLHDQGKIAVIDMPIACGASTNANAAQGGVAGSHRIRGSGLAKHQEFVGRIRLIDHPIMPELGAYFEPIEL